MNLEEAKGLIPSSYGGTRTPRPSYLDKELPFAVDVPRCSQADRFPHQLPPPQKEDAMSSERDGGVSLTRYFLSLIAIHIITLFS